MLILVGSTNPVKIQAAVDSLNLFEAFVGFEIVSCDVTSGVASQPATLDETMQGSINRARAAFLNAQSADQQIIFGIGIEGGLTRVELANTGYMNICSACVFDGSKQFLGLSSGFEHPEAVISQVFDKGLEVSDAYVAAGLLADSGLTALELSQGKGAIGYMTLNRVDRKDYCVQALIPALGALLRSNPSYYGMELN